MAELGHPVIGPQSYQKLTPGEIRVYAEGMNEQNKRQAADDDASYNEQSKKKRDEQALQKVHQKVKSKGYQ